MREVLVFMMAFFKNELTRRKIQLLEGFNGSTRQQLLNTHVGAAGMKL